MAQKGDQLDRETFSCSICLEVLKDPVTIPCGHSYCMNCIKTYWDEGEKKLPSCPQCRRTFTQKPELAKNTMFAALLEQMKKTGLQAAPADHCYAGPGDVACDVCSGRKLKAVKSCLVCLASYCQKHLQPHRDSPTFKKHQLVDPSKNLQDNICPRHAEVRGRLQDILRDTWTNVSLAVTDADVLLPKDPTSRAGFLKYSCEITLDPNTVNTRLLLSEQNRKATTMDPPQSYPDHPDRFSDQSQVLSRESLTGRRYWEVEVDTTVGEVGVAVSYKNISRSGGSLFGFNDKSWSLRCFSGSYYFWYNSIETSVSGPWSSRIGVYLDHRAGVLSFYNVAETMTLLHKVQTSFTWPLHAGVWVYGTGNSAEFCKLK